MTIIIRGLIIDINLEPSRGSETGKIRPCVVVTNKQSIADCLQTRPVDYRERLERVRGEMEPENMARIDQALRVVFELDSL